MSDVSGPYDDFFKTLPVFQGAFAAIIAFKYYVKGAVTSITSSLIVTTESDAIFEIKGFIGMVGFVIQVVGLKRFFTTTDLASAISKTNKHAPTS